MNNRIFWNATLVALLAITLNGKTKGGVMKTILITAAILVALPISAEMDGGHVGDPEHIKPVKKVYSPGHQVFY
ncbi:MAG: hypothetical protein AMK74_00070 [Nitrospira bacterium SM23_35]|nr:MAG: hypothetical protein AMK74_00070 [Nitrospira bacterium SM23_35]